jgi:vanillate O-demethylase monooxygenase subunit
MGRDAPGAAGPPHPSWLEDPEWAVCWGYLHVKGSYVHMHENLLDLSHLSFLHAKTFGTPEYARTPVEMNCEGDKLEVWRHVQCQLPAIYAKPLGWQGARAIRSSGSQYVSPGLHINTGIFRNLDLPTEAQSPQPMVKVAQLVTPETATTTHYWTAQARNFATHDADLVHEMLDRAAVEDVDVPRVVPAKARCPEMKLERDLDHDARRNTSRLVQQ